MFRWQCPPLKKQAELFVYFLSSCVIRPLLFSKTFRWRFNDNHKNKTYFRYCMLKIMTSSNSGLSSFCMDSHFPGHRGRFIPVREVTGDDRLRYRGLVSRLDHNHTYNFFCLTYHVHHHKILLSFFTEQSSSGASNRIGRHISSFYRRSVVCRALWVQLFIYTEA